MNNKIERKSTMHEYYSLETKDKQICDLKKRIESLNSLLNTALDRSIKDRDTIDYFRTEHSSYKEAHDTNIMLEAAMNFSARREGLLNRKVSYLKTKLNNINEILKSLPSFDGDRYSPGASISWKEFDQLINESNYGDD